MIKQKVTVKNKTGIHARPASILIKTAKKYEAQIELVYNEKNIPVKGMMGLLSAGITGGSRIEIICEGNDEQEAMTEVMDLFNTGFGEE